MKTDPPKLETSERRALLRELFLNACSLALLKQMVLVPASTKVNGSRPEEIPDYYRG